MLEKISYYTSVLIFSMFLIGYANASNKDIVHSTDYVKGSLSAYNIKLHIITNGVDGGPFVKDGFEMWGHISTKTSNGKPNSVELWRCDDVCTNNQYNLTVSGQILMTGVRGTPYITWEGDLWDHDGTSKSDLICRMNPDYKIKMSDVGKTITTGPFSKNNNSCKLVIEAFDSV